METWPSSSNWNTGSVTGTKVGQMDQLRSCQTRQEETRISRPSDTSTSTFRSGSDLTSDSDMMDGDFPRRDSNQSDTDVFLPTTQPVTSLSEQRQILEQKRREIPSAFANSAPISHTWRRVAEYVNALPSIPEPGGHGEMNGGKFGRGQRTQAKRQRIWSEGSGERRRKSEEASSQSSADGHGHPRRLTSSTSSNLSQLSSQWSAGSSQQGFDVSEDLSTTLLAPISPPPDHPKNLDDEGCKTPSRVDVPARPKDLYKQTRFHLGSSESDAAAANGQNSTQEGSADKQESSRLPPRERPLKRQMTNSELIAMASQHRQQHSVHQKRQNLFSMGSSNISDNSDTDVSALSVNSIDDLLTARRDPEEILLNLGFGRSIQEDTMDRIPSRFLQQPSEARGISVYAFLNQIDELERGCGFSLIGGLRSLGPAMRRSSQMGLSPLSSRSVTPSSPQPTEVKGQLDSAEIQVKGDRPANFGTETGVKDLEGPGKRAVTEKNNNKTSASRTVVFPEAVVTNHSSKSSEDQASRVTGQVKGQSRQGQTELNRRWDASTSSEFESSQLTGSDGEQSFDSAPRTTFRPFTLPLGQPLLAAEDDNRDAAARDDCASVKPLCLPSEQEQRSSSSPTNKGAPSETAPGNEKSRRRKLSVERQSRICDFEDASISEPKHEGILDSADLTSSRSSKNGLAHEKLWNDEVGHERLQDGGTAKEKGSPSRPRPLHVDVLCSGGIRLLDAKEDSFEFEELSSEERLEDANAAPHSTGRNHHRGRRGSTQSDSSGFSDEGIGSSEFASPHQAPNPADNCSKITSQAAQLTQTSFDVNEEEIELFESQSHNDDNFGHAISSGDAEKGAHPVKVFVTNPEPHQRLPSVSSLQDSAFDDNVNESAKVLKTNKAHKCKRAHTFPDLASPEKNDSFCNDPLEIHQSLNATSSELDTIKSKNTSEINNDSFKNTAPPGRRRPKLRKMRSVDPDFYSYKRYEETTPGCRCPGAKDSALHVCALSANDSRGILEMADLRSKSLEHGLERTVETAEEANDTFPSGKQLSPIFLLQTEQETVLDGNNVQNAKQRAEDQIMLEANNIQETNDSTEKEHKEDQTNGVQDTDHITSEEPHIGIACSSSTAVSAVIPSSTNAEESRSPNLITSKATPDIHSTQDKGCNSGLMQGDEEKSQDENFDSLADDDLGSQPEVVDCHLVCEEFIKPLNIESESLSPAVERSPEESSQISERTTSNVQASDRKSLQDDSALCSQPEVVDFNMVCEEVIKPLNIESESLSPAVERSPEESLQRREGTTSDVQASDRKSLQEDSTLGSQPEVVNRLLVCEEVVKPLKAESVSLSPTVERSSEESLQRSERTTQVQASDRTSLQEGSTVQHSSEESSQRSERTTSDVQASDRKTLLKGSGANVEERESREEATAANVHPLERSETRIEAVSREEHVKAREELKVLLASQDDSVHLFPALPTNNQEEAIEDLKLLQRALCRYHQDLDLLETWSYRMYADLGLNFTREERENLGGLSKVRYQIKGEIFSLEKTLMERYQSALTSAADSSEAGGNIWSVSLSQVMCEMVHLIREQTSLRSFLDDLDALEQLAASSTLGSPSSPRLTSPPSSSSSPRPRKEDKSFPPCIGKDDEKKNSDPKCISKSVDPNRNKSKSVDPNRDKSKSIDPSRDKSKSVDSNWDKSKSVDSNRDKSKSVDPNMEKSKFVDPNMEKSKFVDPNMAKSKSVDPNKDKSKTVDPNMDESESANRDTSEFIDPSRDTLEFVDPLVEVSDLVDLTFPQVMSQEELVEELEQAQQDLARMRVKAKHDVVQAVKQVRESVMSGVRREFHLEAQLLQVQMQAKDLEIEQLRTLVNRLKGLSTSESSLDDSLSEEPQREGKIT